MKLNINDILVYIGLLGHANGPFRSKETYRVTEITNTHYRVMNLHGKWSQNFEHDIIHKLVTDPEWIYRPCIPHNPLPEDLFTL